MLGKPKYEPPVYRCEVCGEYACYGFGRWAATIWFCPAHRQVGIDRMAARAAAGGDEPAGPAPKARQGSLL